MPNVSVISAKLVAKTRATLYADSLKNILLWHEIDVIGGSSLGSINFEMIHQLLMLHQINDGLISKGNYDWWTVFIVK